VIMLLLFCPTYFVSMNLPDSKSKDVSKEAEVISKNPEKTGRRPMYLIKGGTMK